MKGRPSVITAGKVISEEQLLRLYTMHGSVRKVASIVEVSPNTVSKYLKDMGVEVNKPGWGYVNTNKLNFGNNGMRTSLFVSWIKNHPNQKLPRNVKRISEITGLSYNTVRSFIDYHQRVTKKFLKNEFDNERMILLNLPLISVDKDGKENIWYTGQLTSYRINIDKFTSEIFIHGLISSRGDMYTVKYKPYLKEELEKLVEDGKVRLEERLKGEPGEF